MQRPNAGKQPTPASSAENSDIEADRRDSLERETSNDRRDDSASDDDSVLGEARAMAARVQQANVASQAAEMKCVRFIVVVLPDMVVLP